MSKRGCPVCRAPKYGRVLSDVESGNPDECASCRFVRLVKPLSLDRCCHDCSYQVVWGGHVFGFTGEV